MNVWIACTFCVEASSIKMPSMRERERLLVVDVRQGDRWMCYWRWM